MGKHFVPPLLILLLSLGTFLAALALPYCPPPEYPPKFPPKHPPHEKPPVYPKPPHQPPVKPPRPPGKPSHPPHVNPPYPPHVQPPHPPKPPVKPPHPPIVKPPKPPAVKPPYIPRPPIVYPPPTPVVPKPPPTPVVPKPPPTPVVPSPTPPAQGTCPIDTLKLGACVDLLSGLVHVGIGSSAKDTCCPVLQGLADLDAAVCLCTTIKAKLLNINIIIPIALEILVDCGKTPPSGFKCA